MHKIGLMGGSFNPAHGGHRHITLLAQKALGLDEIWWLVSPGNPLKDGARDMAEFSARLASARKMARAAPIKPTAIEQQLGTRYTMDTLRAIKRRYPKKKFIWMMGEDNLVNFHLWRDWRKIAKILPIAVIGRPGYNGVAQGDKAMGWLARHVHRESHAKNWTKWSTPALVILRLPPDNRSATAVRRDNPDWFLQFGAKPGFDNVTHLPIAENPHIIRDENSNGHTLSGATA